eukprot:TRINITY_DN14829_c0_g1_i4.p1 TRINITY_DN14829_c0_g1~~TRINITY_DN14829_c0_g1_i4.p1  ORF type:complete len:1160 (+),score=178.20 TRINITY_DN14829_c0_g1_i4:199-3480(+)
MPDDPKDCSVAVEHQGVRAVIPVDPDLMSRVFGSFPPQCYLPPHLEGLREAAGAQDFMQLQRERLAMIEGTTFEEATARLGQRRGDGDHTCGRPPPPPAGPGWHHAPAAGPEPPPQAPMSSMDQVPLVHVRPRGPPSPPAEAEGECRDAAAGGACATGDPGELQYMAAKVLLHYDFYVQGPQTIDVPPTHVDRKLGERWRTECRGELARSVAAAVISAFRNGCAALVPKRSKEQAERALRLLPPNGQLQKLQGSALRILCVECGADPGEVDNWGRSEALAYLLCNRPPSYASPPEQGRARGGLTARAASAAALITAAAAAPATAPAAPNPFYAFAASVMATGAAAPAPTAAAVANGTGAFPSFGQAVAEEPSRCCGPRATRRRTETAPDPFTFAPPSTAAQADSTLSAAATTFAFPGAAAGGFVGRGRPTGERKLRSGLGILRYTKEKEREKELEKEAEKEGKQQKPSEEPQCDPPVIDSHPVEGCPFAHYPHKCELGHDHGAECSGADPALDHLLNLPPVAKAALIKACLTGAPEHARAGAVLSDEVQCCLDMANDASLSPEELLKHQEAVLRRIKEYAPPPSPKGQPAREAAGGRGQPVRSASAAPSPSAAAGHAVPLGPPPGAPPAAGGDAEGQPPAQTGAGPATAAVAAAAGSGCTAHSASPATGTEATKKSERGSVVMHTPRSRASEESWSGSLAESRASPKSLRGQAQRKTPDQQPWEDFVRPDGFSMWRCAQCRACSLTSSWFCSQCGLGRGPSNRLHGKPPVMWEADDTTKTKSGQLRMSHILGETGVYTVKAAGLVAKCSGTYREAGHSICGNMYWIGDNGMCLFHNVHGYWFIGDDPRIEQGIVRSMLMHGGRRPHQVQHWGHFWGAAKGHEDEPVYTAGIRITPGAQAEDVKRVGVPPQRNGIVLEEQRRITDIIGVSVARVVGGQVGSLFLEGAASDVNVAIRFIYDVLHPPPTTRLQADKCISAVAHTERMIVGPQRKTLAPLQPCQTPNGPFGQQPLKWNVVAASGDLGVVSDFANHVDSLRSRAPLRRKLAQCAAARRKGGQQLQRVDQKEALPVQFFTEHGPVEQSTGLSILASLEL